MPPKFFISDRWRGQILEIKNSGRGLVVFVDVSLTVARGGLVQLGRHDGREELVVGGILGRPPFRRALSQSMSLRATEVRRDGRLISDFHVCAGGGDVLRRRRWCGRWGWGCPDGGPSDQNPGGSAAAPSRHARASCGKGPRDGFRVACSSSRVARQLGRWVVSEVRYQNTCLQENQFFGKLAMSGRGCCQVATTPSSAVTVCCQGWSAPWPFAGHSRRVARTVH